MVLRNPMKNIYASAGPRLGNPPTRRDHATTPDTDLGRLSGERRVRRGPASRRFLVVRPGRTGDELQGFHKFVDGVAGKALRFDGQTTSVVRAAPRRRPASAAPSRSRPGSALQTYPWTWCALVNQEKDRQAGYFFGIDPEGYFGLQIAVGRGVAGVPLRRPRSRSTPGTIWPRSTIAASGITLYLQRQARRPEGRIREARLRAGRGPVDRSEPDAPRAQPRDQGRAPRSPIPSTGSSTRSGSTIAP